MEGDETFYAVSRQSRVINAVATQSYNSLYSKCGSGGKEAVHVLLQNLRVKICLNGEDNETAKHVTELCGKVIRQRYKSYSHHSGMFSKNEGKNKTVDFEEKPTFEEWDFYQLQTQVGTSQESSYSEAIIFNGGAAPGDDISKKVRLKPLWIPGKEKEDGKKDWEAKRIALRRAEINKPKDGATPPPKPGASAIPNVPGGAPNELPPNEPGNESDNGNENAPGGFGGGGPNTSEGGGGEGADEDKNPTPDANDAEKPAEPPTAPLDPPLEDPFKDVKGIEGRGNPSPEPTLNNSGKSELHDLLDKSPENRKDPDYPNDDGQEPIQYPQNTADGVKKQLSDLDDADANPDAWLTDYEEANNVANALAQNEETIRRARYLEAERERIKNANVRDVLKKEIPEEADAIELQEPEHPTDEQQALITTKMHRKALEKGLTLETEPQQTAQVADYVADILVPTPASDPKNLPGPDRARTSGFVI